jgi:iron complex outermembrane receptor protein
LRKSGKFLTSAFKSRRGLRPAPGLGVLGVFVALLQFARANPPQQDHSPGQHIAPTILKSLSLEELSQIEVTTPSKQPVKAFQTPAAIYVITGEDIRRSGVTSIPEALRLAPGVEVARIDANKWSIGIRGFGSRLTRSVLVLIDGRTVFTPLFDGTYWEVQDTLLEDIDRIEVIRGPGGTIWGPNAVNGVINILTKDAKDTNGTLVSAGGGNEEQGFLNFRYGAGDNKGFNYRVYAKTFTRSPEVHPDGRNFDDWRAAQAGFRLDWNKSDRDTFTLQGDLYSEHAGERVQAVSYTPPYSANVDANALLSGGNIMGKWRRTISEGNDIQLQVSYDRTSRSEANFGEIRNTFDIDFLDRFRMPARQQITWGLGARVDPVDNSVVVSGLTFVPNKRTDYLLTAFLQDEIGLVDQRLSLTLGTKFLRTNFTDAGPELEPSARLLWTPTERHTVWAAFTHALRTPSDAEANFNLSGYIGTTGDGTPYFARFNANPQFASEQLNGYELGYRRLFGQKIYFGVAGFYNHYHDLFSEDLAGSTFLETSAGSTHLLLPAQFRNDLRGATKGVEFDPEWRPTSFWRLRGSYSYLHMNVDKLPGSGDVGTSAGIQGSSPQHQVTVQSGIDLSKKLQLDLTYRYISALPGQRVQAYSTGDARLGWQFSRQFELAFVGRNLFQPSHAEDGGDPGPLVGIRRSAYAKLTWRR